MAVALEVHPDADAEALEAADWYHHRNPAAAVAFHVELRRALTRILEGPETFPPYIEGTRRCLLRRFPYEVVFVRRKDTVVVIAIAHCRRKPGYWASR